jgi:hypothetical protein
MRGWEFMRVAGMAVTATSPVHFSPGLLLPCGRRVRREGGHKCPDNRSSRGELRSVERAVGSQGWERRSKPSSSASGI